VTGLLGILERRSFFMTALSKFIQALDTAIDFSPTATESERAESIVWLSRAISILERKGNRTSPSNGKIIPIARAYGLKADSMADSLMIRGNKDERIPISAKP
jgi:hypothetical protein